MCVCMCVCVFLFLCFDFLFLFLFAAVVVSVLVLLFVCFCLFWGVSKLNIRKGRERGLFHCDVIADICGLNCFRLIVTGNV